ncbi:MAG: GNAT family N-acetyltransferase [Candidatus Omnitrophica bacterium]|nr:GNAT family N-acetyltransferase [Candidatus Omnitrophota bacterium]
MCAVEKVGRNHPCPCGSGLKYKKCCEERSGIGHNLSRARNAAKEDLSLRIKKLDRISSLVILGIALFVTVGLICRLVFKHNNESILADNAVTRTVSSDEIKLPPQQKDIEEYSRRIEETRLNPDDWVKKVLAKSDKKLFLFGDMHFSIAIKDIFRTLVIPGLKSSGVDILVMEYMPSEAQPLIDKFNVTGEIHPALQAYLDYMEEAGKLPKGTFKGILLEARTNGIMVYGAAVPLKEAVSFTQVSSEKRAGAVNRQREILVNVVRGLRRRYPDAKIAVWLGNVHNDRVKDEVVQKLGEPALSVDLIDPLVFHPVWSITIIPEAEKEASGAYRGSFLMSRIIEGAKKLGIGNKIWVARPLHAQFADWVIYIGNQEQTDPHRAKPGNHLPQDPAQREEAIQQEISANQLISVEESEHLREVDQDAMLLAMGYSGIIEAIAQMSAMPTRVPPESMPNLYSVIRNNACHIDRTLLNKENYTELLLTRLHEASHLAHPQRTDEENEEFAQYITARRPRHSEKSVLISHSAPADNVELILKYGFYANLESPGGYLCEEDEASNTAVSYNQWAAEIRQGCRPEVFTVFFRVPEEWIAHGIGPEFRHLSIAARAKVLPEELLRHIKRKNILHGCRTDLSRLRRKEVAFILDPLPLWKELDFLFRKGRLGHIPASYIDVQRTLQFNQSLCGKIFLRLKVGKMLLSRSRKTSSFALRSSVYPEFHRLWTAWHTSEAIYEEERSRRGASLLSFIQEESYREECEINFAAEPVTFEAWIGWHGSGVIDSSTGSLIALTAEHIAYLKQVWDSLEEARRLNLKAACDLHFAINRIAHESGGIFAMAGAAAAVDSGAAPKKKKVLLIENYTRRQDDLKEIFEKTFGENSVLAVNNIASLRPILEAHKEGLIAVVTNLRIFMRGKYGPKYYARYREDNSALEVVNIMKELNMGVPVVIYLTGAKRFFEELRLWFKIKLCCRGTPIRTTFVNDHARADIMLTLFRLLTEAGSDPHSAKPGKHPTEAQVQEDIGRASATIAKNQIFRQTCDLAIKLVGDKDVRVTDALVRIRDTITVRAGPFTYIYGTFRNNILYLDSTSSYGELLLTLIHEARVIAYPKSRDEENEAFARICVFGENTSFFRFKIGQTRFLRLNDGAIEMISRHIEEAASRKKGVILVGIDGDKHVFKTTITEALNRELHKDLSRKVINADNYYEEGMFLDCELVQKEGWDWRRMGYDINSLRQARDVRVVLAEGFELFKICQETDIRPEDFDIRIHVAADPQTRQWIFCEIDGCKTREVRLRLQETKQEYPDSLKFYYDLVLDTSVEFWQRAEPVVYRVFEEFFGRKFDLSLSILPDGGVLEDPGKYRDMRPPSCDERIIVPVKDISEYAPHRPLIAECYLDPEASDKAKLDGVFAGGSERTKNGRYMILACDRVLFALARFEERPAEGSQAANCDILCLDWNDFRPGGPLDYWIKRRKQMIRVNPVQGEVTLAGLEPKVEYGKLTGAAILLSREAVPADPHRAKPRVHPPDGQEKIRLYGEEYELPAQVLQNIRPAQPGDEEGITRLAMCLLEESNEYSEGMPQAYRGIIERGKAYGSQILVYAEDKVVLGYIWAEQTGNKAIIREIAVKRDFQRRKIGSALWALMMQDMQRRGVTYFEKGVDHTATAKLALRFGFKCDNPRDDGSGMYYFSFARVIAWQDIHKYKEILSGMIARDKGTAAFFVHPGKVFQEDDRDSIFKNDLEAAGIYFEDIKRYLRDACGVIFILGGNYERLRETETEAVLIDIPSAIGEPFPCLKEGYSWGPVTSMLRELGVKTISPFGGEKTRFLDDGRIVEAIGPGLGCVGGALFCLKGNFDIRVSLPLCFGMFSNKHLSAMATRSIRPCISSEKTMPLALRSSVYPEFRKLWEAYKEKCLPDLERQARRKALRDFIERRSLEEEMEKTKENGERISFEEWLNWHKDGVIDVVCGSLRPMTGEDREYLRRSWSRCEKAYKDKCDYIRAQIRDSANLQRLVRLIREEGIISAGDRHAQINLAVFDAATAGKPNAGILAVATADTGKAAASHSSNDGLNNITVYMGKMKVASSPDILVTYALGPYLGIALYDPVKKTGGLAHAMLPSIELCDCDEDKEDFLKFVDCAIPAMVKEMREKGCEVGNLVAGISGATTGATCVGGMNIQAAKTTLQKYNIPCVAEDLGNNYSRTLYFDPGSGEVAVERLDSQKHISRQIFTLTGRTPDKESVSRPDRDFKLFPKSSSLKKRIVRMVPLAVFGIVVSLAFSIFSDQSSMFLASFAGWAVAVLASSVIGMLIDFISQYVSDRPGYSFKQTLLMFIYGVFSWAQYAGLLYLINLCTGNIVLKSLLLICSSYLVAFEYMFLPYLTSRKDGGIRNLYNIKEQLKKLNRLFIYMAIYYFFTNLILYGLCAAEVIMPTTMLILIAMRSVPEDMVAYAFLNAKRPIPGIWECIHGWSKSADPHRAKPGMNPTEEQIREDLNKASKRLPVEATMWDIILEEAIGLSRDNDPRVAAAIERLRHSIEIRAGSFTYIYGTFRNNILYLDSTASRNELLLTIIHEARVIAYPQSKDKDNEAFAQACFSLKAGERKTVSLGEEERKVLLRVIDVLAQGRKEIFQTIRISEGGKLEALCRGLQADIKKYLCGDKNSALGTIGYSIQIEPAIIIQELRGTASKKRKSFIKVDIANTLMGIGNLAAMLSSTDRTVASLLAAESDPDSVTANIFENVIKLLRVIEATGRAVFVRLDEDYTARFGTNFIMDVEATMALNKRKFTVKTIDQLKKGQIVLFTRSIRNAETGRFIRGRTRTMIVDSVVPEAGMVMLNPYSDKYVSSSECTYSYFGDNSLIIAKDKIVVIVAASCNNKFIGRHVTLGPAKQKTLVIDYQGITYRVSLHVVEKGSLAEYNGGRLVRLNDRTLIIEAEDELLEEGAPLYHEAGEFLAFKAHLIVDSDTAHQRANILAGKARLRVEDAFPHRYPTNRGMVIAANSVFEFASELDRDRLYDSGVALLVLEAQKERGFWQGWDDEYWQRPGHDALIAYENGRAVALVSFVRVSDEEIHGDGIYVAASRRRDGIGTRLRNRLIEHLHANHYKRYIIGGSGVNSILSPKDSQAFAGALAGKPGITMVPGENDSVAQVTIGLEEYIKTLR